jgi:M6 family metalloprotease-like protein
MPSLRAFAAISLALLASAQVSAGPRGSLLDGRGTRAPAPAPAPAADTGPMIGRLELVWGDAAPAAGKPGAAPKFTAALVDDAGVRHPLDAIQAQRAAGDLSSLFGKRVAVSTAPAATKGGAPGARVIDAIVPVGDLSAAKAAEFPSKITGTTVWVTLMCKFSDIATEQKTRDFFLGQYGTAAGQLGHYWQEVSYGQINLTGSGAYGWATLPQPRSYYVTKDANGKDKANLNQLFTDCVAAHDANVNFAANGGVQGINMMFNGDLDGYAWGGGQCATLDGVNKCFSTTWNPPWSFGNLAPLCHEMGHGYGLPHANNSDADSDPYDNPWDNMSDTWYNGVANTTYGTLPKHISMYSRDRLGWVVAARKRTLAVGNAIPSVTIDRASLGGSQNVQMLVLNNPAAPSRYYVVEVRKRGGSYEAALAGDAVIIHSVDTSRGEPAWSVDADTPPANRANNEGSMFKVGETWTAPDYSFRVTVNAATANGFDVTVRRLPRKAPGQLQPAADAPPVRQAPRLRDTDAMDPRDRR